MIKTVISIFLMALGVVLFVLAGYDDSPGGQLLGLAMAALGVWRLIVGKNTPKT